MAQRRDETRHEPMEGLAREAEQTATDTRETVDAIRERLTPQHLRAQASETIREATVGRAEQAMSSASHTAQGAGSTIIDTMRHYPAVPAALAALGVGWLLTRVPEQRRHDGAGPAVGPMAEQARTRVGETTAQAQDRAQRMAEQAQRQASQVSGRAQIQAQRARGQFTRVLEERPLAVGAVALGIGAGIGLLVPETKQEQQMMGEARERLVHRAQQTAQEVQHKAQRVAEAAQGAARQEAREQHLTG